MKANELRIGNYINYLGSVVDCDAATIHAISRVVQPSALYQPIPLTEEWLLRLGFNENRWMEINNKCCSFRGMQIGIDNTTLLFDERDDLSCIISKKNDFVHQIQNLYFALTGKELPFKDAN